MQSLKNFIFIKIKISILPGLCLKRNLKITEWHRKFEIEEKQNGSVISTLKVLNWGSWEIAFLPWWRAVT